MKLRIIHAGSTSALYSQAIYHGIAEQMQLDDDPVLVIVQPNKSYICIGLHQQLTGEIDTQFCDENKISILRRQVGGGTVLLDENQVFFHFIFPKTKAPNQPKLLYPYLLTPVLNTYQHFGIPANLKSLNDIQVNNKKIGGTGAGTINNATVLVGSFLFDFDYHLMSQCINSPSEKFRECLQALLEKNITTINQQLPSDLKLTQHKLIQKFIKSVASSLKVKTENSQLTSREIAAIKVSETELSDKEWLNEEGQKLVEQGLKISSGIYLLETTLTFNKQPLIIRMLYKDKTIDQLWLETNASTQVTTFLNELINEINKTKPLLNLDSNSYNNILKIAATIHDRSSTSNIANIELERLINTICKLGNIREY